MTLTTWHLETTSPNELNAKPFTHDSAVLVECATPRFEYNRFLYQYVGKPWQWTDKLSWSDAQWQTYAHDPNLRLWVLYVDGCPAGYFELNKKAQEVEIAYFGLAEPFIAQGLGGPLLSCAIEQAWKWGAQRVTVHTCSLDHPSALANYQARGMRIFKEEVE